MWSWDTDNYKTSNQASKEQFEKGMSGYENAIGKYTGNAGYQNSLEQANQGTQAVQGNTQASAASAALGSGMNRSLAQATARNTAANNAANIYQNQQNQAATQGNNQVSAQGTRANLYSNYGQLRAKQAAGNIGGGILSAISDENAKNITPLDNYHSTCGKYFNKKKCLRDLIWEKK